MSRLFTITCMSVLMLLEFAVFFHMCSVYNSIKYSDNNDFVVAS